MWVNTDMLSRKRQAFQWGCSKQAKSLQNKIRQLSALLHTAKASTTAQGPAAGMHVDKDVG